MTDKYRPRLHFTPGKGWINDPNGMILLDGAYHLFFQHNPNGIDHADMHWGHAVSRDLVLWEEQLVALAPDALGSCFSGSAIETALGEVKLFYTAHTLDIRGQDHQTQCLVHADRALTRYQRDAANPILPNPGLPVFRDPKVIWHDDTGRWIMLVTLGQTIGFYSSTNLTDWAFESSFGEGDIAFHGGVWECPDMIRFGDSWVLIVGLQDGAHAGGSGTGYLIGCFDGSRFVTRTQMLWLDHGRDFYAAQSFFDRSGGPPTIMAWVSNWDYARQTPAGTYRGAMSLPRVLSLVETPDGPRLRQSLPAALRNRLAASEPGSGTCLLSPIFDLAPGETAAITLFGEAEPQLLLTRGIDSMAELQVLRGDLTGVPAFAHDLKLPLPWPESGPLSLDIHLDHGIVEILAAEGLIWITCLHFPDDPFGPAHIEILNRNPIPAATETAHG